MTFLTRSQTVQYTLLHYYYITHFTSMHVVYSTGDYT